MTERPIPHVVVIHRWRDSHALYGQYLDHVENNVSYLTTELGRHSVPDTAAAVEVLPATDDLASARRALGRLVSRFGTPSQLVALNEGDLDTAAELRSEWGCPGQDAGEVIRFRDKLMMISLVEAAGIAVPPYADAPDVSAVRRFVSEHSWPVVIKPRRGTASRGVRVVQGAAALDRLDTCAEDSLSEEPHLVQQFIAQQIIHIDGLWTGSGLGPWRASRYLSTCHEFNLGRALGSAEIDDPEMLADIEAFTIRVAGALSDRPWVFHLEAFVKPMSQGGAELTFLEAGARVGGAEIPFVWREVHGIDLMSTAVDIQLLRSPVCQDPGRGATAGWLLVPTPVPAPCVVVSADMGATLALSEDRRPYFSAIPSAGDVIPKVGGYEHVGARFRFRGASTLKVEQSILQVLQTFRLNCETLGSDVR